MRTYVVYKYTSPSGKVYVGQTYNETMRKYYHTYAAIKYGKTPFQKAIRKYGIENFEYEVIVSGVPHYMIGAFEKYWINYFKSNEIGYNCTVGGDGVVCPTKEVREKISITSKGRHHSEEAKKAIGDAFRGKKLTEEHKQKLRKPKTLEHAAKVGKAISKKVKCIEADTVYESIYEANISVGLKKNSSNITSVCKGRRKTAGGYHWTYVK